MNEEEYMQKRLGDQLSWYSKKSGYNQKCYKRTRLLEIVAASLIPFLSGMGDRIDYSAWLIGGLGVLIAISAAISSLYRFQENWIEYRTTEEQLKNEKYLYLTGTGPYSVADKFPTLVERTEAVLAKENSAWATALRIQAEEKTA